MKQHLFRALTLLVVAVAVVSCSGDHGATPGVHGDAAAGLAGAEAAAGTRGVAGGDGIAGTGGVAGAIGDAGVDADDASALDGRADVESTDASVVDAVVRRPIFVVVLGSSTAAGFGLPDPSTSWVRRYEASLTAELPGSKVTNLAVSGYSTYQVQPTGTTNPKGQPAVDPAHNVTAALALHPDAIIVNLPSNDAAMGVPVATSMANLEAVAAKTAAAAVEIWVTTSQPRQLDAAGIALILGLRDAVEHEFGDHALDFFTPLAAANGTPLPQYNQGDGIHPNAEGHQLLFGQVHAADLPTALAKALGGAARD